MAPTRFPGWPRAIVGGSVGSLGVLAVVLTLGLLAWAALGEVGARVGVQAAFASVVVGGSVYALLGRSAMPAGAPSSATALILAAQVAALAAALPADTPPAAAVGTLLALAGATVAASGVLQLLLAASGLVQLVRHVPQPVLAGFMNGVALLILVAQVPMLLGLPPGFAIRDLPQAPLQPGALALGLATAALVWALSRRRVRLPSSLPAGLVAMVAGALAYGLLQQVWPGLPLGGRVTAPAAAFALPELLWPAFGAPAAALLQAHGGAMLGTALVLAIIGSLESALGLITLDQQLASRHDPRRELMAIGCANVAAGVCGGLPVVFSRARAIAVVDAGAGGRTAALAGSLLLGALFALGGTLLGLLPLAVLAGTMVVIAVGLIDRWSGRLFARALRGESSRELAVGLAVVALVCGVTIWRGFPTGVALGLLLSMLSFVVRMSRSLVRADIGGEQRPSRRIYPDEIEARLAPLRRRIRILELEGALFFGSGEQLLAACDRLHPETRFLVLDLRRVGTIDETGAATLQLLAQRLAQRGVTLLPAGVSAGSDAARTLAEFAELGMLWPDADRATEEAERRLLGGGAGGPAEVALADCSLAQGLDDAQRTRLAALLQALPLAAGATLFAQGDAGDRLYVLTRGSISIFGPAGPEGRPQRYLSFSPGVMFGEMAMLDGAGRSAAAVADSDCTLLCLDGAALHGLERDEPALAAALYRNIAVHLSARLRAAARREAA